MKTLYVILFFACAPFFLKAQCQIQAGGIPCSCFGVCDGNAVCTMFGGTGPYTYLWMPGGQTSPSVSGLCAGTYTVVGTDAVGCNSTATATVTQPTQIVVTTSPTNATCQTCCNGFITSNVTGGTSPYTYSWSTSPVQTSPTAQSVCPGTYTLCVTDANGCQSCNSATVNFATGISSNDVNENLELFPNPACDFITLKENFANNVAAVISVSNILGETIFTKAISSTSELNEKINLSGYDNGTYFITVKTSAGISVRRFVKQ